MLAFRRNANPILRNLQSVELLWLIQAITKNSVFSPDKIPIHRNSPAVSWWESVMIITIDNELATLVF